MPCGAYKLCSIDLTLFRAAHFPQGEAPLEEGHAKQDETKNLENVSEL